MSTLTVTIQSQIKATIESDKEFQVNFDDAWQWLEYSRKDNAKHTLVKNFEENIDYIVFLNIQENPLGGRPKEEIYLTADCFKQLAMLSGTPKGKEVRLYFVECEKELKAIKANQPKLPSSYKEALLALVAAEEEKELLISLAAEQQAAIKVLEPKAQTYDQVIANNTFHEMADVAKIINIKGMGRNNLFEFLRDSKVLRSNNTPYQNYASQGYFKVVIKPNRFNNRNSSVTLVSPKGIEFIIGLLEYAGYKLPQVA
jgi:anti-repressor protein